MYEVAVLFERSLTHLDVEQILALHESVDQDVTYHLLTHMQRPDLALSASMAAFAGGPIMPAEEPETMEAVTEELMAECKEVLDAAVAEFKSARGISSDLSDHRS